MHTRLRQLPRLLVLLAIFATVVAVPTALGAEGEQLGNETTQLWFVQLGSEPTAGGTAASAVAAEHQALRNRAEVAGIEFTVRRSFSKLWNGFSVRIEPSQLGELSRLPGVTAIYPVERVAAPPVTPADPQLETAKQMTGADVAQSELGLTGRGIRIAVMDTGVDYNHPDLGGCFGPGCRVVSGYDFVGDAYDANPANPTYNPVPAPDPDPDDCNGHGTHVAGIATANGQVKGVAPGATVLAYRVFGCEGSTESDIMIAAMERALDDGAHVLNMSIGEAFTWPQSPTAQASDRLVEEGVVVVASIGNSGTSGLFAAGAPGLGRNVIGVASFDNTAISALSFVVNPGGRRVPYQVLSDAPPPPTSGTSPEVVYVGRSCLTDPLLADPAGKVALAERGVCTFNEKYQRAVAAGAVGVIIMNNSPGLFAGGGVVPRNGVWAIAVSQEDGLHLRGIPAGSPVTLTWSDVRVNAPNPTGGRISSFSSYGLAPDLTLKPDIGAPGGLIRSTWPIEKGSYTTISGTSMASPHVAGAAALLLQDRPDMRAPEVRSILQNSAEPRGFSGNPAAGLEVVHRQGAGLLRIDRAIRSNATVRPGKLALGESERGPAVRTLTVGNTRSEPVTYDLSHAPALSTFGSTFAPQFATGYASAAFGSPTVTVPALGLASFTVTITAAADLPDGGIYGGYLVLTPQGSDGQVIRVPYAGYKGDYQAIKALTSTACDYPWLAKLTGTAAACGAGFARQTGPATYTLVGNDIPFVLVHLDHQARRLEADVFDADTNRYLGRAFAEDYVPRNSTPTSFFAFAWDGTTVRGSQATDVPNGRYRLELRVTKALAEDDNLLHQEGVKFPVITIARAAGTAPATPTPAPQPPAQTQTGSAQVTPTTTPSVVTVVTRPTAATARLSVATARVTVVRGVRGVSVRVNGTSARARITVRLLGQGGKRLGKAVRTVPTNRLVRVPNLRVGKLVRSVRVSLA